MATLNKKVNSHLFNSETHNPPKQVSDTFKLKDEINGKYKEVSKKAFTELGLNLLIALHCEETPRTAVTEDHTQAGHLSVSVRDRKISIKANQRGQDLPSSAFAAAS